MWPVATTKRLLDTGADDARDDHESKRHESSDDALPMAQEPSSGSGVKRSNLEAIRRAETCQSAGGTTCSETSICNTDG